MTELVPVDGEVVDGELMPAVPRGVRARDWAIYQAARTGASAELLGRDYGISVGRVHQILGAVQATLDAAAAVVPAAGGPVRTWQTQAERDRVVDDAEQVFETIHGRLSENTRDAYKAAGRRFLRWCQENGRTPLPASPETLLSYLRSMERDNLSASTVRIALAALKRVHRAGGQDKAVEWAGGDQEIIDWVASYAARRARNPETRPKRAAGARRPIMALLLDAIPEDAPYAVRDRAALLLGKAMAARRSELANIVLPHHVRVTVDGMEVLVAYSKTDQSGEGTWVAIQSNPDDPDRDARLAVQMWIDQLASVGIHDGPLFRHIDKYGNISTSKAPLTGQAFEVIIKRARDLAWAKLEATEARQKADRDLRGLAKTKELMALINPDMVQISPHSVRRGWATDARASLWDLLDITRHGRWSPQSKSVHDYIEEADRHRRLQEKPVAL